MTPTVMSLLKSDLKSISPYLIVGCAAIFIIVLSALTSISWVHPELLGTSVYIWNDPAVSVLETLRKVFDWKAFDPNVNRVRPLNDLFEVIDAYARPFLVRATELVSTPLPSTMLTVCAVPFLLYGWGRRVSGQDFATAFFVLALVLSTGFLSVTVAYIRPAKKINILLLCTMLFFVERSRSDGKPADFWKAFVCCYLSFFADEQALINWFVISTIYWRECFRQGWVRIVSIALLPLAFLATTSWFLPAMYAKYSVHGAWNAMADSKKFTVFSYLFEFDFYVAALTGFGRSFLTTFGVYSQAPVLVFATAIAVIALPAIAVYRWRNSASINWLLAAVALAAASAFFTLLDWYPFPHTVSYLGSFNYYYHSSVIVLVFGWIVFGWRVLNEQLAHSRHLRKVNTGISLSAVFVVASLNLWTFYHVNSLVKIIHFYPYNANQIWEELAAAPETGAVQFNRDPLGESAAFTHSATAIFGSLENAADYNEVLMMVKKNSIMTGAHLSHLLKSFYPWKPVSIRTDRTLEIDK